VLNPGGNLYAARLSPDERVAYLAINTGQAAIFISVRSSRFDPFGPPTPLSAVNDASFTNTPSATADGLVLFFESNRSGAFRIYRAERSFLGAEFSKPLLVTDLGNVPSGGPFVTPDGGALYFHSLREETMDLYRAVNNGTGFDSPERLLGVSTDDGDEYAPVVTPDELTIFYQTSAGLMSASRDSLELPFGPSVTLTELDTLKTGTVPQPDWVSLDGCRLYYMQHDDVGTGRLYMAERLPPR
jgi:Tol biopolymer transport system component